MRIREFIVAFLMLAASLAASGQTPTPSPTPLVDDEPIKVDTLLINIPFVVSDRDGRYVGGIKKEDVIIELDGERQEVEYFATSDLPLSVAIILDMSGSTMAHMKQIREAAIKFVEGLNPADRAMVVTFDQHRAINIPVKLTSDRKKLKNEIEDLKHNFSGGRVNPRELPIFPDMHDAIYNVMSKEFVGVTGRKAIVVLTDGFTVGRTVGHRVFDDTIIEGDVVIYPMMFVTRGHVGPGKDSISYEDLYKHRTTAELNDIANKTGGRLMIAAKGTDFKSSFEAIGDELRKQYLVGFYPSKPDVSQGRKIGIGVRTPGLRVRTKSTIRLKRGGDK